jgi:glycosyltransferase involved in cell wall biosynthesis
VSRPLIVYGFSASLSAGFYTGQFDFMRRAGYDVAVISSPGPEAERLAANEGATFSPVGIAREISPRRDLRSLVQIYRLLRKLRPGITNFGTPKAGLLGGLAAFAARVPGRVYTLHGLRLETASGMRRLLLWCAEWISCHTAHVTLCVSESLRKRAVELGVVRADTTRVLGSGTCNGVDASRFSKEPDPNLRAELGIPPSAPVVGFVGRLVRDKGIPELVGAFLQLSVKRPDLRLLLVGDFEEGDPVSGEIRTLIAADSKIVCAGFVADVAPYYKLMQVLALPTHREGFGAVSLEAQASCIPVVTTNATGVIDSVVEGVTGSLVPVGDIQALTREIERLLDDDALRARMGTAGRERAVRDFAPEVIWELLAECYTEVRSTTTAQLSLEALADRKNA